MKRFWLLLCMVSILLLPDGAWGGTITDSTVREVLVQYLRDHGPAGVELEQWELRRGDLLPVKGKILGLELAHGARWGARTPIRLRLREDSGRERTYWISAALRRTRRVVVATRNLPMGHRIEPEDLLTEVREGWRKGEETYGSPSELVGKKVFRPVAKGACIKKWHVREDRNMHRGDDVMIVAEKGAIRIEAPGQLLESGNPGDRVRVLNKSSGKELFATVVDLHTVAVSF